MAIATLAALLLGAPLLSVVTPATAGAPRLSFSPPADTFRQGLATPDDYTFNHFNASVQIYPFRAFTGDIEQQFKQTLLRDWISPLNREENVAGISGFQELAIPGATQAFTATFVENKVGLPRPHARLVIVAGNQAAIVDSSAGTMQSWQQATPALAAMADTFRVEAGHASPPPATAAGRRVAGLYQGMKSKYTATMANVTGSATYVQALHYYLLSPSGQVYRAYDNLPVPGGDPARFDFEDAQARDPDNSGTYTVDGDNLVIQLGSAEKIVTTVPKNGKLTINAVTYERQ